MRWKQPSTRHKSRTRNIHQKDRGSKRRLCPFYFVNLRKLFHARSQQGCGVVQVLLLNHCRNQKDNGRGYSVQLPAHRHLRSESGGSHFCCSNSLQLLERSPFFLCNLYTLIISIQIVIGCQVVQAGRRTFSQLTSTFSAFSVVCRNRANHDCHIRMESKCRIRSARGHRQCAGGENYVHILFPILTEQLCQHCAGCTGLHRFAGEIAVAKKPLPLPLQR